MWKNYYFLRNSVLGGKDSWWGFVGYIQKGSFEMYTIATTSVFQTPAKICKVYMCI